MTAVAELVDLPPSRRPALVAGLLIILAIAFSVVVIMPAYSAARMDEMARLVLHYSTLPRLAMAIVAGAALGFSGALFQLALKNPLAAPTTLGVSAGANLALVLATLFAPALLGYGRDLVALSGSLLAAFIVIYLGSRQSFSTFGLVLAGLIVSMWCGSLAAILILMNDRYLASLFIWGAGSLSQQSWQPVISLTPKLIAAACVAALMIRPMELMEAGDEAAGSLGMRVGRWRVFQIGLAVCTAAFVVSAVGVIGFVGLVAPGLARLSGARRPGSVLLWSTTFGAALLWLTDELVQWGAGAMRDFVPTGAVTAAIGAPVLLILLRRAKTRPQVAGLPAIGSRNVGAERSRRMIVCALTVLALLVFVCLLVGRSPQGGWTLPSSSLLDALLSLRLPRVVAAAAAGGMLAIAGVILQRLTANALASPEILGVSAGATAGVTACLFVVASPSIPLQLVAALGGALVVLGTIFALARRGGFDPQKVLLLGVALAALVDAVSGVIAANGDPRAMFLLRWISGSTYSTDAVLSGTVLGLGLVLGAAALLIHRWLDILPLGSGSAQGLGIDIGRARFLLFLTAGALSAAATLAVGPMSFAGLMGPHLVRQLGLRRGREQIIGGFLAGAAIMMLADWLGRTLAFPYEMPAGLVASLIGAPLLILLMRQRR